jgi:hypothetical protein
MKVLYEDAHKKDHQQGDDGHFYDLACPELYPGGALILFQAFPPLSFYYQTEEKCCLFRRAAARR